MVTKIQPKECSKCQVSVQPNYNAVKIDINNPHVNVGQSCPNTIYEYPKNSLYSPQDKNVNNTERKK